MDTIKRYHTIYGSTLLVRFEDARKIKNRKFFKDKGPNALQGAGSIKRDCHIWEDFLKDNNITYQAVGPLNGLTKLSSEVFQKVTGWTQQTNNHARDAAMLVYGI